MENVIPKGHKPGCGCFACKLHRERAAKPVLVKEEDEPITDEYDEVGQELEDYVEYVAHKMWEVIRECDKIKNHPYSWPLHQISEHVVNRLDMDGTVQWVEDVFEGEIYEFIDWLDQALAGMELLLRAGKGQPAPRVCEEPVLSYLRSSNRPRHLTEILGMLAEKENIYLDRGRLSSFLSTLQDKDLTRNTICPVRWAPGYTIERGYWWADDEDPQQLCLNWDVEKE